MAITVRNALEIGRLAEAKILAGAAGLDNIIRAVDIIDVPDELQILEDISKCGGAGLIIFSPEIAGEDWFGI